MFAAAAMDQIHTSTGMVDTSSKKGMPLGWPCPTTSHISGTTGATSPLLSHHCPRNGIARRVTTTKKCISGRAESCAELRLGKAVGFQEKNMFKFS